MDSEWDLWLIKFPKILAESGTNRLVKQRLGYTSPQIEHRKPKNFSPKKKTLNEEHFRSSFFWFPSVFFRVPWFYPWKKYGSWQIPGSRTWLRTRWKTRWWFQMFTPKIAGRCPLWRAYFSDGLVQPPTTPRKINIEPENDGLEDDFPFPGVYSQVPC